MRRQYFNVSYELTDGYKEERRVIAISEYGAKDTIRWIYKDRLKYISAEPTFEYVGMKITPSHSVIGDY